MRTSYLVIAGAALALLGCSADQPMNTANGNEVNEMAGPGMPNADRSADTAAPPAPVEEVSDNGAAPAGQPSAPAKEMPAAKSSQREPATPRPEARPERTAGPQAEPAPTSNATCTPEHAAMGHC